MKMDQIPFQITNWQDIPEEKYNGEKGYAIWKTQMFNNIRVRIVEYSPDYLADHWCEKGHILFCLTGQLDTELDDGRTFTLMSGMSYQVADHAEAHRSSTKTGARLFIVD
ncbi:MAG: DHCW motif cupin fold protein [Acinetobacter sp.]|nr:DHCW motif cupin fold protein [Acinetobacter sp.]MBP7793453.1 DHCW motif cupin fold protein [Acinetobacter sp.]MBP8063583.1 DHCW motif cupin fold protein [Acinetobacter sp.]